MEKFEQLSSKLYNPRSLEDEQNVEDIEILRSIEEKLNTEAWFVGCTPYGSSFKGYNFQERTTDEDSSDIDISIIVDSSKSGEGLTMKEIRVQCREAVIEVGKQHKNIHMHTVVRDINSSKYDEWFHQGVAEDPTEPIEYIADLSRMVTGLNIESYRSHFKEFLHSLPADKQSELLQKAFDAIVLAEEKSLPKISERLALDQVKTQELFQARKDLWKHRMSTLWGVDENVFENQ